MGSAYAWLAMKDASADQACRALGLDRCGGEFDFPETELSGAALPAGWYLVVAGSEMFDFFMDFSLEALSESHDLLTVDVEEHAMYHKAAYWRGGARLWTVTHDGEEGVYHLEAEGELPADFDSLQAEYVRQQDEAGGENADVDHLCEVPLELARRITGFGYNVRNADGEEPVFEELDVSEAADEASGSEEQDGREELESPQPQPEPQPQPAEEPPLSGLERWLHMRFGRGDR